MDRHIDDHHDHRDDRGSSSFSFQNYLAADVNQFYYLLVLTVLIGTVSTSWISAARCLISPTHIFKDWPMTDSQPMSMRQRSMAMPFQCESTMRRWSCSTTHLICRRACIKTADGAIHWKTCRYRTTFFRRYPIAFHLIGRKVRGDHHHLVSKSSF